MAPPVNDPRFVQQRCTGGRKCRLEHRPPKTSAPAPRAPVHHEPEPSHFGGNGMGHRRFRTPLRAASPAKARPLRTGCLPSKWKVGALCRVSGPATSCPGAFCRIALVRRAAAASGGLTRGRSVKSGHPLRTLARSLAGVHGRGSHPPPSFVVNLGEFGCLLNEVG